MNMKLPVFIIAVFLVLLAPKAIFAQENSPALTVKKLFVLLDKPGDLINKEGDCYAKWDGLDVSKLNKPFIKKYLDHLKSTGLFSQAYLAEENKYYQDRQKEITKDGLTYLRDEDVYTLSQDPPSPKEFIAVTQKIVPVIAGNKATMTLRFKAKIYAGYKVVYRLVKENNSWVINSISST